MIIMWRGRNVYFETEGSVDDAMVPFAEWDDTLEQLTEDELRDFERENQFAIAQEATNYVDENDFPDYLY